MYGINKKRRETGVTDQKKTDPLISAHVLKKGEPHSVMKFEFSFPNSDGLCLNLSFVDYFQPTHAIHLGMSGKNREIIMRQNREKLLSGSSFLEYVRLFEVQDINKGESWLGVMVLDLMFLTLNSRFRTTKELEKIPVQKEAKGPIRCDKQMQMCRVISIADALKYIRNMKVRSPERRTMKETLIQNVEFIANAVSQKLIEMSSISTI